MNLITDVLKNDTVICYIRNGERGDSFLETAFARIQNSEHTIVTIKVTTSGKC